jgi:hypothetical protein
MIFMSKHPNAVLWLPNGSRINFSNGFYKTEDEGESELIQKTPGFGVDYWADTASSPKRTASSPKKTDATSETSNEGKE